jgi:hypothetical protein
MATGRIGATPVLRVRWSKLPTTGTTVLSGLDDNSVALVYDAGYEAVYRNGVLLSRGNDYTATNGTTVTLIDATLAGDVIEIFANDLVPLTDAISKGQFTAKGALLSASAASTPGVVTVGANDTVLTADSSTATGLKWATPVSGKVLQVINAIYTTGTATTTSTFADTGLTASITPTNATSKVLVFITIPVYKDTSDTTGQFKVLRGATEIATLSNAGYTASSGANDVGAVAINYLDSPATTSATTYKVQFASSANASRIRINDVRSGSVNNSSSITLMEIGA